MDDSILDNRCVVCLEQLSDKPHHCKTTKRPKKNRKRKPNQSAIFAEKLAQITRQE